MLDTKTFTAEWKEHMRQGDAGRVSGSDLQWKLTHSMLDSLITVNFNPYFKQITELY